MADQDQIIDPSGDPDGMDDGQLDPPAGDSIMAHKDDDLATLAPADEKLGGLDEDEDIIAEAELEQRMVRLESPVHGADKSEIDNDNENADDGHVGASESPSPELEMDSEPSNGNGNDNTGGIASGDESDGESASGDENDGDVANSGSIARGPHKSKYNFLLDVMKRNCYFRGQPDYALWPASASRIAAQGMVNYLLPFSHQMRFKSIDKDTWSRQLADFEESAISNSRDKKGYWFNVLLNIIQVYLGEYYYLFPHHFDSQKKILKRYVSEVRNFDLSKGNSLRMAHYAAFQPGNIIDPTPYVKESLRTSALRSIGRKPAGARTMRANVIAPESGDSGDDDDSEFEPPAAKKRRVTRGMGDHGGNSISNNGSGKRRTRVSRAPSYDNEEIDIRSSEDSGATLIDRRSGKDRIKVKIGRYHSNTRGQHTTAQPAPTTHNTQTQSRTQKRSTQEPRRSTATPRTGPIATKNTQKKSKKKHKKKKKISPKNTRIPKIGEGAILSRVTRVKKPTRTKSTTSKSRSRSRSKTHSQDRATITTAPRRANNKHSKGKHKHKHKEKTSMKSGVKKNRHTYEDDPVGFVDPEIGISSSPQYTDEFEDNGDNDNGGRIRTRGRGGRIKHRSRDDYNDAIATELIDDEKRPREERKHRSRTTVCFPLSFCFVVSILFFCWSLFQLFPL